MRRCPRHHALMVQCLFTGKPPSGVVGRVCVCVCAPCAGRRNGGRQCVLSVPVPSCPVCPPLNNPEVRACVGQGLSSSRSWSRAMRAHGAHGIEGRPRPQSRKSPGESTMSQVPPPQPATPSHPGHARPHVASSAGGVPHARLRDRLEVTGKRVRERRQAGRRRRVLKRGRGWWLGRREVQCLFLLPRHMRNPLAGKIHGVRVYVRRWVCQP